MVGKSNTSISTISTSDIQRQKNHQMKTLAFLKKETISECLG